MGGPELAVGSQPLVQIGQRLGPDPIKAPLGVNPRLHQSSLPENPKVLGDRRLAQSEHAHQVVDRALTVPQHIHDGDPARLGQDVKCG